MNRRKMLKCIPLLGTIFFSAKGRAGVKEEEFARIENNIVDSTKIKEENEARSYITNCYFKGRSDQKGCLFSYKDGEIHRVHLDGYAIVPIEEYEKLIGYKL